VHSGLVRARPDSEEDAMHHENRGIRVPVPTALRPPKPRAPVRRISSTVPGVPLGKPCDTRQSKPGSPLMHADRSEPGMLVHSKTRPNRPDEPCRCGSPQPIRVHLCASVANSSSLPCHTPHPAPGLPGRKTSAKTPCTRTARPLRGSIRGMAGKTPCTCTESPPSIRTVSPTGNRDIGETAQRPGPSDGIRVHRLPDCGRTLSARTAPAGRYGLPVRAHAEATDARRRRHDDARRFRALPMAPCIAA
jgi:hypothetical protein